MAPQPELSYQPFDTGNTAEQAGDIDPMIAKKRLVTRRSPPEAWPAIVLFGAPAIAMVLANSGIAEAYR